MSTYGIFHAVISTLPVGFGLWAFVRDGRIDPRNSVGKLYVGLMLASSFSAWGFLATAGVTLGQVLTLAMLLLVALGTWTMKVTLRTHGYVQSTLLSASYLLLMVFLTTETLTRVPVGSPFATGPNDPALLPVRLALLVSFALGLTPQLRSPRVSELKSFGSHALGV